MLTQRLFRAISLAGILLCSALPAFADALLDEGLKFLTAKDYKKAFYAFETAKKNPSNGPHAMYYQAMCYFGMGQKDYAKTMLSNMIAQYPTASLASNARDVLNKMTAASGNLVLPDAPKQALEGVSFATGFVQEKANSARVTEAQFKTDKHGRILVNVRVNNKINYQMMLDTGADVCSMSEHQALQAGIDTCKSIRTVRLYGTSGEVAAKVYRAMFQVGSMYKEVDVYVTEASSDYALLGRNFFADVALEVNDPDRTLRFIDRNELRIGAGAAAVPYRTDGHGLFITAKINGRECEMVLDTGCATTAFTDKQWSALGMTLPTSSSAGYTAGIGGRRDAKMFDVPSIEFGGIIKHGVPASVSLYGAQDKPLLGMSFLQGLRYIINPFDRRIYISK